jgi:hypothetical protein
MSRTIPATLIASTTAPQLSPFFATSLDFDAGTVRYWTGYGTITIGSATYAGIGAFSSISTIEETEDLSARGLPIDLTGVPNDLVAAALNEPYQGRTAAVRFGTLNADTGAVIESITIFSGRMDTMAISNDGKSATIGIQIESKLVDFQRTRESRYTHEEQLRRYPADMGLEYVAGLQDKVIYWGNANATAFRTGGGGNANQITNDDY